MKVPLLILLSTIALTQAEEYTNRFDNYDVDVIIHNRRLLVPYVKCVLDQEKCNTEGRILKAHINDALQSGCAKCTEYQRSATQHVISHLILNEKDLWRQLKEKYNTASTFVEQYEKDAKEKQGKE